MAFVKTISIYYYYIGSLSRNRLAGYIARIVVDETISNLKKKRISRTLRGRTTSPFVALKHENRCVRTVENVTRYFCSAIMKTAAKNDKSIFGFERKKKLHTVKSRKSNTKMDVETVSGGGGVLRYRV